MVGESALLAVALIAGGNRVLLDNLGATDSGTRFRAAYALGHTYDLSSTNEADAVRRLIVIGLPGEQAAAADGVLQRKWPNDFLPDDLANAVFPPVIRRQPEPRGFSLTGMPNVPPFHDPMRMLAPDHARTVMARKAGFEDRDFQLWLHRADPAFQRSREEISGNWDRERLRLQSRASLRPPCFNECLDDLMRVAWMGMDMAPILEVRKPPTMEVEWWTETMFRLVRAAGGDSSALSTLVHDVSRINDVQARGALLVWLVRLPPGLEIHPTVRPAVVHAAMDNDAQIRRYAIELLAVRPELHGYAGAANAFASALSDRDPDVRARAACELWDLAPLPADLAERVRVATESETDAVVGAVLRAISERR